MYPPVRGRRPACGDVDSSPAHELNISGSCLCSLTGLNEVRDPRARSGVAPHASIETIAAFACGFNPDIATTQKLMQLSSHAFNESDKHRAYMFCITGFSGRPLAQCSEFLEYGHEPPDSDQEMHNPPDSHQSAREAFFLRSEKALPHSGASGPSAQQADA